MNKIVLRASDERGPSVTGSKAAAILASGGTIYAVAVDADGADIHGCTASARTDRSFRTGRVEDPARVNWSSPGGTTAWQAKLHAQAVSALVKAIELGGTDWFSADHIPGWVADKLGEYDEVALSHLASRAYCSGEFNITAAWEYAVGRTLEARDNAR